MSDHSRVKPTYEHNPENPEQLRAEYRRPRDVLLSLVGDFIRHATVRLDELVKRGIQEGKNFELLDIKSHIVSRYY